MRMKYPRALALTLIVLLAGCTSPPPPDHQSQTAPDANFAAYSTFGWQLQAAASNDAPMRLLDTNIRAAIQAEMTRRGYTEVQDDPQLWVKYETAADERVKSNPFQIGIGLGSFGSNMGGSVNVGSPSVQSYREGPTDYPCGGRCGKPRVVVWLHRGKHGQGQSGCRCCGPCCRVGHAGFTSPNGGTVSSSRRMNFAGLVPVRYSIFEHLRDEVKGYE